MSELRLFLRRDSFQEGMDCAWSLLDATGQLRSSGARLDGLPKAKHCRLVLAGELVTTVKAALPDLPERRLAPLLPAAAESATLMDADSIHAVLMGRDQDGKDGLAILAILEAAWLRRMLARLADAGLHPDAALPEYLLLPWSEGSWSVGRRGDECFARLGRMEGLSLDGGEPPVGLVLAGAQRGWPEAINVYQATDMPGTDLARWRQSLHGDLGSAGPWDWRNAPWPDLPDLLQGPFASRHRHTDWMRWARPVSAGLALLAALQGVGMLLDWSLLAHEDRGIRREMGALAERALPAHAAVVDPAWQVREQLRALRAASGNPSGDSLVGLLGRMSNVWPKDGGQRVKSLTYEDGTLTLLLGEVNADWLRQLTLGAAARGLEVIRRDDKEKGVFLNVRLAGKEGHHGP